MNIDRVYRWTRALQVRMPMRLPEFVRGPVRSIGYALMRRAGLSIDIRLGDIRARIPAHLSRITWGTYEPESMGRYVRWCKDSGGRSSVVLDIGSSVGIYAVAALFADADVEVIAFDSDIVSLRLVPELAQYAPRCAIRLRRVLGYLDEQAMTRDNIKQALTASEKALAGASASFDEISYRCLSDPLASGTPVYSLDWLLDSGNALANRRVLLKCDVEGAEVRVLQGARELLLSLRPELLLSVHDDAALSRHGGTIRDLKALLEHFRYRVEEIAQDHEAHWWCTPAP